MTVFRLPIIGQADWGDEVIDSLKNLDERIAASGGSVILGFGDLIVGDTTGTATRLPVGPQGFVPVADPAAPGGISWQAAAPHSMDAHTNVQAATPTQDQGLFYDASVGQFVAKAVPALPYAPEGYKPDNFVPIIYLEEGAAVPAGTAPGTLIGYLAATGGTWGYGTFLGGAGTGSTAAGGGPTRTLTAAAAVGTLVVIGVAADAVDGIIPTWTVTDSKANTWTTAATHITGSSQQSAILYSVLTTAFVSGDTIQVKSSNARSQTAFVVATVVGAHATPLDKTVTNGGGAVDPTPFVGPTTTTSYINEIAFGAFGFTSGTIPKVFGAGTGSILVGSQTSLTPATTTTRTAGLVYKILTTTGTPTMNGTISDVGSNFSAVAATFRKA